MYLCFKKKRGQIMLFVVPNFYLITAMLHQPQDG